MTLSGHVVSKSGALNSAEHSSARGTEKGVDGKPPGGGRAAAPSVTGHEPLAATELSQPETQPPTL